MWKLSKDIYRQLLAGILLVALTMQLSGWYLYSHSHELDDGTVITHAHPYNKGAESNPFKSHLHNDFDQVFSASLQFLVLALTFLFLVYQIAKSLERYGLAFSILIQKTTNRLGRSPPSFQLI